MLPSQALLLLRHLDNDLVIILYIYIYCSSTYTYDLHGYINLTWRHFFSHGTPLWPKLAAPRKAFFMHPFCRANTDPPVTKSGYGLLLGCRLALDRGSDKNFFLAMFEQKNG